MFGTSKAELKAIVTVQDCTIRLKDVLLKSRAKQIESLTRSRDELAAKVAELTAEMGRLRGNAPSEPGIVVDGTHMPQRVFIDGHAISGIMSIKNSNEPGDISTTTIVLHGPYSVREHAKKSEPHIPQPYPMWTEWNGGGCPVPPDTVVEVRFFDGSVVRNRAGEWDYCWKGKKDFPSMIAAYRIVP